VDPRRAPQGVRRRHRPNQRPDVPCDRGATPLVPALPGPKEAEAATMPGDDGLGFHDDDGLAPRTPDMRDPDPQEPIRLRQPHAPRTRAFQDVELVAQRQDLELQRRPRAHRGTDGQEDRHEGGPHGSKSLPWGSPPTSIAATRTEFFSSHNSTKSPALAGTIEDLTKISGRCQVSCRWKPVRCQGSERST